MSRPSEPFVVRWRQDGRQRIKRFAPHEEALRFDECRRSGFRATPQDEVAGLRLQLARVEARMQEAAAEPTDSSGRADDGVYPYKTRSGTR